MRRRDKRQTETQRHRDRLIERKEKRKYNVLEIKSRNRFSEDKVSSWQMLLISQERQRLRIEL